MDPDALREVERAHHGGTTDADVVDCSANTNPRTPPGVAAVYRAALDDATRYPDDDYPTFRAAAASVVDCDPAAVVPTPGGLAAIRLAIATTVRPDDSVLIPVPSFAEYAREVRLQGGTPTYASHDGILDADPEPHAMAIVATPNNPTGECLEPAALRRFADRCRAAGTRLLVDEAFLDYTDRPSLAGTPGTVVARSLTKLYGLPGIRMGYAVASGEAGEALRRARRPWAVSTPAAAVGAHCLDQRDFVHETRERVRRERARLREGLERRYDVAPSEAPFLLVDVGDEDPAAVCRRTRAAGVVIRDATTFRGLDSHVRIAVRDGETTDRVLEALDV